MKIKGKSIPKPKAITIPIPRVDDEPIILTFEPVMDWEEFNTLWPEPIHPTTTIPGKGQRKITPDKDPKEWKAFQRKVDAYSEKQMEYSIVKGLLATEGLEWESIDIQKPDTWKNYQKELETHFTKQEVAIILNEVILSGMPTEERREEAKKHFFEKQAESKKVFTSRQDEQSSTPSSEPANV